MNIFQRPDGLFVAEDRAPEPAKPKREEPDGSVPLPSTGWRWFETLSDAEKDELLGYLPSIFLHCGGSWFGAPSSVLDGKLEKLMARARHLSGKEFEVFT